MSGIIGTTPTLLAAANKERQSLPTNS